MKQSRIKGSADRLNRCSLKERAINDCLFIEKKVGWLNLQSWDSRTSVLKNLPRNHFRPVGIRPHQSAFLGEKEAGAKDRN